MANTKSSSKKEQVRDLNFYTRTFLSLLLVFTGAFLLYIAVYRNFDLRLSKSLNSGSTGKFQEEPIKVYIPKLARTLYVSNGEVVGGRWEVSATGVSYLTSSAVPGSQGNSVIYGHNTLGILGGLWRVHDGDYIYVVMNDGNLYKYQVFDRKEINPSQVNILDQTADSRLTIYTCSGFLDSARFVVVSKLQTS